MDRRQRNFLLVVAGLVVLFVLALVIISTLERPTIPAPTQTPVQPGVTPSPTGRTPSPTTAAPSQTPSRQTPQPQTPQGQTPEASITPKGAQSFYVAPDGSEDSDGSKDHPWSLQTALDQPSEVQPGDTIWLLAGEYKGSFTTHLQGAKDKPITVRAAPGARAILSNDGLVLDIGDSAYVNFWGLEITDPQNTRDPKTYSESAYGVRINQGKSSHDIKFINMIVHDMPSQGFGWWQANKDSEIYGSLIYFNGVTQFDHGIYVHNTDGTKRIVDNLIFDNASHGIHAYGEKDYQKLNNITIDGNTVFDNGSIGFNTKAGTWGGFKRNILLGGLNVAMNPVITNNYTYYPSSALTAVSLNLGYKAGSTDAVVENNYLAGGRVEMGGDNSGITMLKNTFMGFAGIPQIQASLNQFLQFKPADAKIFVRPNKYEAGRANVTIYNWSKKDTVTLPADSLKDIQIKPGDHYELHNVQDYFNDIISGTYDGQKIDVPMNNHTVAQPTGLSFKPDSTFPEFGAFVLIVTPAN